MDTLPLEDRPAYPKDRRRKGLGFFLLHNPLSIIVPLFGLILTLLIFSTIRWLSFQTYECPDWALKPPCHVRGSVQYYKDHTTLLQGIISTIYSIGLAALLYTTYLLGETTIWPIFQQHEHTLRQFNTYLLAARGSLASQSLALVTGRSFGAGLMILCVSLSVLLHTLSSTFVGAALETYDLPINGMKSSIPTRPGIGPGFEQVYPSPRVIPWAATKAFSMMSSWSKNLATEPLPEFREYLVDRTALAKIGQMKATAVRMKKNVTCRGHSVITKGFNKTDGAFSVDPSKPDRSIQSVRFRRQLMLSTWVDGVTTYDDNPNRSTTTVIFANINGDIEGGNTYPLDKAYTISALACDIDIELVDDIMEIGDSNPPLGDLGSLNDMSPPGGKVSNLTTWLGAATTIFGVTIAGAQPMFETTPTGFGFYTTSTHGVNASRWSAHDVHKFINMTTGAFAMSMVGWWDHDAPRKFSNITSTYRSKIMDHQRSYILLAPIAGILAATMFLAGISMYMHHFLDIPVMRQATITDILLSSQTESIRETACEYAKDPIGSLHLSKMKVRYVYFTDFGISRIVPGELTTGTDGTFGPMTRAYVAPETLRDNARRGRAVDVFSLGCVFLEIGTLLIAPRGSRERFRRFREEKTGTIAYAENTLTTFQWIRHLRWHWSDTVKPNPRLQGRYARHGAALPDLAFLMLDPNPDHRITSRQLVALISTPKLYYFDSVNAISCNGCRISLVPEDDNLPLHSVYKELNNLEYPETAEQALEVPVAPHWEASGCSTICGGELMLL
ncbi:hypothetical protein DM02DRAFT_627221 [Periconia macrospinosa]|uniref:Protein kinase domain-containing protein n=1 Tax=Periconia macrospinosa TaxID=97972 RepID=A0A2V1DUP9_9PLEO|nr:hypothetical protein DM02DRAFT_627221 [Periconia macrospinosa]